MNWKTRVLWAPEDGSGAGGGAAGAGAAAAGDAAGAKPAAGAGGDAGATAKPAADAGAGGGATTAAAAGAGYRPDNLPDHLFGRDDKDTIDRLFKSVDGYRKAQSDRGEVPSEAKAYDYQPSDVVKPYATALANDPFFAKVRDVAHASGLTTKQFNGFLDGVLGEMIAGQMVDAPFSADKEREALLPDIKDAAERTKLADRMSSEAIARVKAYGEQGMPKGVVTDLLSRMDRAATVQLVNWIAAGRREAGPVLGGASDGKAISAGELRQRNADPRNDPNSAKFDKGFAEETDRLYKTMYPGGGDR